LKTAAIRLIARKVQSVAFLATGWIPALRDLSKAVYGNVPDRASRPTGKAVQGYARKATFVVSGIVECTIANVLGAPKESTWHGEAGDAMPILRAGLQKAIDKETGSMQKRLETILGPVFKRHSAK
jgi:hypothetical protein